MTRLLPSTRAESSGFTETSLHADVMRFLGALEATGDPRLQLSDFGESPEGRTLPLVVLSSEGARTPAQVRALDRPVMLVINGIHAGEVEGKEASMAWMRDLLRQDHGLLERLTLVVVPLFNPDGNDRIDPENRKLDLSKLSGHIGPIGGVGTRVNAAGINLNRDYLRHDAAEMRALSRRVYQAFNPHLTVDCHATNGSIHRFDLTYDTPHTVASGRPEPIAYARRTLLPEVTRRIAQKHGRDYFFYGNFVRDEGGDGPGWMTYTHHPRFGSNYRGLTGRMDILSEVYSYLPYPERVSATRAFLEEIAGFVAERGPEIKALVDACDTPPERIAVRYRLEAEDAPVTILTRDPYTLDGAPVSTTVPHYARFVGAEIVERPWAYVVPEPLAPWLEGHGLRVDRLGRAQTVACEQATITRVAPDPSRSILESSLGERIVEAAYERVTLPLPEGAALVRADQPMGAVAVYLCEAASDDGAVACGRLPEGAPGDRFPILRVRESFKLE